LCSSNGKKFKGERNTLLHRGSALEAPRSTSAGEEKEMEIRITKVGVD